MTCVPLCLLHNFVSQRSVAHTASKGVVVQSPGHGDLKGLVTTKENETLEMVFQKCVSSSTFAHTLASVSTITKKTGVTIRFIKNKALLYFVRHTIELPVNSDGLYEMKFQVIPPADLIPKRVPLALITTSGGIGAQVQRLHAALGHPNLKRMKDIAKQSFTSPVSNKLRQEVLGLT
jgi:hypothetical protein